MKVRGTQLIFIYLVAVITGCGEKDKAPRVDQPPVPVLSAEERLIEMYCGNCHLPPRAEMLDQKTWHDHVLVRMAAYNGVFYDNQRFYDTLPTKWLEPGEGGERVLAAGIYPAKPVFTRDEFLQIRKYILDHAPVALPEPQGMLPVAEGLPLFDTKPLIYGPDYAALVTAVCIDTVNHNIYTALMKQVLLETDKTGKVSGKKNGITAVVHIHPEQGRFSIADIGNIRGADNPIGLYEVASGFGDLQRGKTTFRRDKLMRPVYSVWSDLDEDGDEDLLLAEYGNLVGRLAWHRNDGGNFTEQLLHNDDGTVTAQVADLDGDGRKDIVSLCANSDEGVDVYVNKGKGQFERKRVLRFPPVYGSAAMELVDWNRDGKPDLMISCGDNGDYPAVPKPYHGVYLYLNQGGFVFTQSMFLPVHGAYGTRTRDYDEDGDPDIAVVSFYPDFVKNPRQGFVFFDNRGNNQFVAATVPQVGDGRWMVMDAGDMDGDKDIDIVLGAFNAPSSEVPKEMVAFWDQKNISVLLLENRKR